MWVPNAGNYKRLITRLANGAGAGAVHAVQKLVLMRGRIRCLHFLMLQSRAWPSKKIPFGGKRRKGSLITLRFFNY